MARNGNITGQVFDDGVIKQIETRQKFLGARYSTDKHLIYQNNQNAFLRLASSVNVGISSPPSPLSNPLPPEEFAALNKIQQEAYINGVKSKTQEIQTFVGGVNQLKDRGINANLTGMELAKACVLFGGIVGIDDKLNPKFHAGLYNSNEDPINNIAAYGWGGISSRGYVPMPSIESADVGFYNRGALQKADVKIKVYSLEQLQIFDLLYFRIGYTMLLEWGHNLWINNEEELVTRNEFQTEPFKKFFEEGSDQNTIIRAIQNQRKNDDYNYDAMLGKVTNFTWKFNDDGSYDINLKLIGLGDIIESLKVNKSAIISGTPSLSPSQELQQRDNNITAGENAADQAATDANDEATKAQEELDKFIEEFNKFKENQRAYLQTGTYTLQEVLDKAFSRGRSEDNDVAFRIDEKQSILTYASNVYLSADSNPQQIRSDLGDTKAAIISLRDFGSKEDNDLKSDSNFAFYLNQARDMVQALINKLSASKDNLFTNNAAARKRAEDQEKESERLKKALAQARQRVEKEKEILSLSPVTSIESKNKSLFNQQLYAWRQEAIAGKGKGNLYKLNFIANSANPDSTGVSTLSLDFYYVRLGFVLDWIQNNLLVYDDTKELKSSYQTELELITGIAELDIDSLTDAQVSSLEPAAKEIVDKYKKAKQEAPAAAPMFTIDTTPSANFCLRFPGQFSSDPTICIIPSKYQSPDPNGVSWNVLAELEKVCSYYVNGNDYAGKLMNIMVNIDHIAGVLDKNLDANGKVNLQKFLVALLDSINDALGNVNKMEPVFDTENNKLTIIEGSSIDDAGKIIKEKEKELNKMAVFNVYGIGSDSEPNASFVTNVDFQVQLPPNMAAMATISAQANGNIVGENATGLSKLNVGLTDRLITRKLDKESIEGAKTGNEDPSKIFQDNLKTVQTIITDLYTNKKYAKDSVSSGRSLNRDIALYLTGNEAMTGKMPSPFFIPFNLSVNMVGLSGMRNYERFSITEDILPYSYRSGDQGGVINFLIKGLTHKIEGNQWETKLESLTVGAKKDKL